MPPDGGRARSRSPALPVAAHPDAGLAWALQPQGGGTGLVHRLDFPDVGALGCDRDRRRWCVADPTRRSAARRSPAWRDRLAVVDFPIVASVGLAIPDSVARSISPCAAMALDDRADGCRSAITVAVLVALAPVRILLISPSAR